MQQLHELYQKILDQGTYSEDRTGTGTIKLIGQQMRFDLQDGFPAVTTKRLAWKTMVSELLFFLQSIPDRRIMQEIMYGNFDDLRNDIWKGNCIDMSSKNPIKFNGYNMGNMYPVYWRQMYKPTYEVVKVYRKIDIDYNYIENFKSFYTDDIIEEHKKTGEIFHDIRGDELEFLGYNGTYKDKRYYLKYKKYDNIIKLNTSEVNLKNNLLLSGEDYYKPNNKNGYLGAPREILSIDPINTKVQVLWYNMLSRVYESKFSEETTISPRWYNYYNFLSDIRTIPSFFDWLQNTSEYELDKDYFGSTVYSRNTTLFLDKKMNQKMIRKRDNKSMIINGNLYFSWKCFLEAEYPTKRLKYDDFGIFLQTKKIKVEWIEDTNEYVYRPQLFIDQIRVLIENIKKVKEDNHHPAGRRLIMDSWNQSWETDSVLGICHPWVQFFVMDNKLSCSFYMRSSDTFLGLPLNIASYALLTHILAQICGLEVGELIYTSGDCHIYQNHLEQVHEQLSRTPKELPTLVLDTSITDIDNFKMDSFKLEGYNPDGAIKAPMAV